MLNCYSQGRVDLTILIKKYYWNYVAYQKDYFSAASVNYLDEQLQSILRATHAKVPENDTSQQ